MKETNGYYDREDGTRLAVSCKWEWWIPDDAPGFCGQWICALVETYPVVELTDEEEQDIIERMAP